MGTKVKGFFKGLKNNISNIFEDEEEEQEIQIGMPTDVKHVAHIGADRPVAESPGWMTEFDDGSDVNSVESLDTRKGNHRASRSEELNPPDMPKSSRHRHHASDTALDAGSQGLDLSTKPKRRRHRLRRRFQEKSDESPDAKVPDVPRKRTRRRRQRDDGGSTNSKDGGESLNNETQS